MGEIIFIIILVLSVRLSGELCLFLMCTLWQQVPQSKGHLESKINKKKKINCHFVAKYYMYVQSIKRSNLSYCYGQCVDILKMALQANTI